SRLRLALLAIAVLAGADVVATFALAGLPWVAEAAALLLTGAVGAAFLFSRRLAGSLRQASETCGRAAAGDLETRIVGIRDAGDIAALLWRINHLLDITDAFGRESGATLDHVRQDKFYRRVVVKGLPGAFRHHAEVINQATGKMAAQVEEFSRFADVFQKSLAGVVDAVGQAATELQSTAQSMSSAAEETNRQAATAAAASSQTTVNMQTVAAATEEMSASVGEIGRQVGQS